MFNPFRVDSCIKDKKRAHFHSSAYGYPVFPTPLIKETALSLMRVLGTFVKNQWTEDMWVFSWVVYLFPWSLCFYASAMQF